MNIIIAEPDTGEKITEINLEHTIEYPAPFPPDGQHLALTYNQTENKYSGSQDICILNTDGSNLTCLTNTGRSFCPSWSPDGEKLVFSQSEQVGADWETNIYTVGKDGDGLRKLISGEKDTCPSWSPDGQLIAYFHQDRSNSLDNKIYLYVANANGANSRLLAFDQGIDLGPPSWSPDGTILAVYGSQGSHNSVFLVPVDGSPAVPIARGSGPAWRPTARIITQ